jgi:hypothetical protein
VCKETPKERSKLEKRDEYSEWRSHYYYYYYYYYNKLQKLLLF